MSETDKILVRICEETTERVAISHIPMLHVPRQDDELWMTLPGDGNLYFYHVTRVVWHISRDIQRVSVFVKQLKPSED